MRERDAALDQAINEVAAILAKTEGPLMASGIGLTPCAASA
jgi:hypothetical protein